MLPAAFAKLPPLLGLHLQHPNPDTAELLGDLILLAARVHDFLGCQEPRKDWPLSPWKQLTVLSILKIQCGLTVFSEDRTVDYGIT